MSGRSGDGRGGSILTPQNINQLRVQYGGDGVGRKKSGPIAYRATSGRSA